MNLCKAKTVTTKGTAAKSGGIPEAFEAPVDETADAFAEETPILDLLADDALIPVDEALEATDAELALEGQR